MLLEGLLEGCCGEVGSFGLAPAEIRVDERAMELMIAIIQEATLRVRAAHVDALAERRWRGFGG